jgi:ParB-like chromosome segregation protein Spo0J
MININTLNISSGTQSRVKLDEEVIADYAEKMADGAKFPPVRVYNDGINSYLADGFHRYFAVKKLGKTSIDAVIVSGTLRDAILYSVSVNDEHGLRRSNEDKRNSVMKLIEDFEWGTWSDSEIARACKVSQPFVSGLRKGSAPEVIKYKGKDGVVHEKARSTKTEQKRDLSMAEKFVADKAPEEFAHDPKDAVISELTEQNEKLQDQLAAGGSADAEATAELLAELRSENKRLHQELKTVKLSRDQFQNENAQLMKQVAALQRQLKKAA